MKAAGRTLTVQELRDDIAHMDRNDGLTVMTEDGPADVQSSDEGVLEAGELYTHSYTDAHELLCQIAEDPKVWTKKKILDTLVEMGYGS